ncbi:PLP-dependent cysteine synthase family protein [Aporhodopirellula aestuarii]|uniref:L-cysteine desulfhydrase Cds1 n=1 Tax=Aporhodopirellula aestuarii TaxID=2950107 RepID=A0ABT0UC31_9BACT|nr:PLP-dependent cysteine synthase family protein [Aporhodopirellula aestuarii]MCM2374372.1 PLP-dependent cysteine synthase family protein [Aporhodopirellula aestuarii]
MTTSWAHDAIARIDADFNRSADTHLIKLPLAAFPGIDIYLKDESIHPSGSLKHRLARSLFLYAICNGWISESQAIVEASSGSTAISEAYFAKLLELPFHTVIPATTAKEKICKIRFLGGQCHLTDQSDIYSAAAGLATQLDGHYMDQFTFAERATDWRGNNNIAESLFRQMELEQHPEPKWVVMGAGTGGTSATIGRYIRYQKLATKLCVVDPENSVYYDYFHAGDASLTTPGRSRIEGIGRPRVEPSFVRTVIDRMVQVPDAASIATMRLLEGWLDRRCGASTGTNLWAVIKIAEEMRAAGETGSIVTLICDGGERYTETYYNDAWLELQGIDPSPFSAKLQSILELSDEYPC